MEPACCVLGCASIFAEPVPIKQTPWTSQLTASSLEGGIFRDDGSARQEQAKPRLRPEMQGVAGKMVTHDEKAGLYTHDAPLVPLNSSRSNHNRASVDGGVFSHAAPTRTKQHKAAAHNRNASSVPGGIFG